MILPWIAIAAAQAGVTAKLTRTAVLDVLGEGYIRTAYAKGLDSRRVFWAHVLRPAIIPVVASVGAGFGIMLGFAAIVDQVFALNGIGQALLAAVKQGDLMVVMGAVLVAVILISLVNLMADICQALLDPRAQCRYIATGSAPGLRDDRGTGTGHRQHQGLRPLGRPVPRRWPVLRGPDPGIN